MAKNMEIPLLYDFYGEMLTEKQRDMVEQYYQNDLSLAEIAENAGISRQGVRDSIKRAENQLFELEERLGLVSKMKEINTCLEAVSQYSNNIYVKVAEHDYEDIREDARHLVHLIDRLKETIV